MKVKKGLSAMWKGGGGKEGNMAVTMIKVHDMCV
jgi:hypothetical protein